MLLIDKIQGWTQNGPQGNDKQIIGAALSAAGGWLASNAGAIQAGATLFSVGKSLFGGDSASGGGGGGGYDPQYMANLTAMGEDMKEKYDEMTEMAERYLPGGDLYEAEKVETHQDAIDQAYIAAQKGKEELLSQGVEMTSYGAGVMQDVVKDKYTTQYTQDYSKLLQDFSGIANQYLNIGQDIYGDYTDLMSSAYQYESMAQSTGDAGGPGLMDMLMNPDVMSSIGGAVSTVGGFLSGGGASSDGTTSGTSFGVGTGSGSYTGSSGIGLSSNTYNLLGD